MKSSNLAWRMDADQSTGVPAAAVPDQPAEHDANAPLRPRFEVRAFERRAFDRRAIVIRDSGLQPFRIR